MEKHARAAGLSVERFCIDLIFFRDLQERRKRKNGNKNLPLLCVGMAAPIIAPSVYERAGEWACVFTRSKTIYLMRRNPLQNPFSIRSALETASVYKVVRTI